MLESRLQLEYWVWFWAPNKKKNISKLEAVQTQASSEITKVAEVGALTLGREAEGASPGQPGDGMALGKLNLQPPHTYREPSRKQSWTLYSRAEGG